MRIIIFSIKDDSLTSGEIKRTLSKAFPNESGNIVAIEESYLFGREKQEEPDSEFTIACTKLCAICGDPIEEEAFRGEFWKAFLINQVIDPIVLKCIAVGPRSAKELNTLKDLHAEFLPKLAISALTTLNEM